MGLPTVNALAKSLTTAERAAAIRDVTAKTGRPLINTAVPCEDFLDDFEIAKARGNWPELPWYYPFKGTLGPVSVSAEWGVCVRFSWPST
jgi:hypothetical protein